MEVICAFGTVLWRLTFCVFDIKSVFNGKGTDANEAFIRGFVTEWSFPNLYGVDLLLQRLSMLYLSHLDLKFSNLAHFVCPVNGKVGEYRYKLIPGNRVPGINTLNHKQVKLGGGGGEVTWGKQRIDCCRPRLDGK